MYKKQASRFTGMPVLKLHHVVKLHHAVKLAEKIIVNT